MDLFEQVLHALEGKESRPQIWLTSESERTLELRTTGYDRWIEAAHDGRVDAINALALILEGIRDSSFDPDVERAIVEDWANELRTAAESGEIKARNPLTLLPLRTLPKGWGWLVSLADLDAFIKARGFGWTCSDLVNRLLNESRKSGETWYDENGNLAAQYWHRGYEPESVKQQATPTTPAPQEKPRERLTWWDVSSDYIAGVMRDGQYATCKELFRALEAKAGPDSPFDKGTGDNRGGLFVREIAQPLSLKTMQNKWKALRELARK